MGVVFEIPLYFKPPPLYEQNKNLYLIGKGLTL